MNFIIKSQNSEFLKFKKISDLSVSSGYQDLWYINKAFQICAIGILVTETFTSSSSYVGIRINTQAVVSQADWNGVVAGSLKLSNSTPSWTSGTNGGIATVRPFLIASCIYIDDTAISQYLRLYCSSTLASGKMTVFIIYKNIMGEALSI